ncbi:MAG: T9SS type A sorting domain-containing protein [Methanosarcinaceae archaeon]
MDIEIMKTITILKQNKIIKSKVFFITVFLVFAGILNMNVYAQIIFQDDFDGYSDSPENHGWGMSSNISVADTGGLNGSRGIIVTYNTSGTSPYWFGKNVSDEQINNIYVRFYFKIHDPEYAGTEDAYYGGCKFLKIFGSQDGDGYANTTWGINYNHPVIREVSYGNGSGIDNDCQCIIRFAGSHTDPEVVVNTSTSDYHLVDNEWHCFEAYFKYNTNGNRDGEYQVWIDGSTVVHATNIKNRHDSNAAYFNAVHFANYSHYNTHTWYLYYDNIVFADSYIGTIGGVGITQPTRPNPDNFILQQNYPNPFNPSTTIKYSLAKPCNVRIKIYNQLGQEVYVLVNEQKPAGEYNVRLDGKDAKGNKLASGVYFYRLTAGKQVDTKKMLYLQ